MRFMMMVKANKDTEAGIMPEEKLLAAMSKYHEDLVKAGVLLDASGLQPSSKGARIKFSRGKRTVIDGPFTEAKQLIAGYTMIHDDPGEVEGRGDRMGQAHARSTRRRSGRRDRNSPAVRAGGLRSERCG